MAHYYYSRRLSIDRKCIYLARVTNDAIVSILHRADVVHLFLWFCEAKKPLYSNHNSASIIINHRPSTQLSFRCLCLCASRPFSRSSISLNCTALRNETFKFRKAFLHFAHCGKQAAVQWCCERGSAQKPALCDC